MRVEFGSEATDITDGILLRSYQHGDGYKRDRTLLTAEPREPCTVEKRTKVEVGRGR